MAQINDLSPKNQEVYNALSDFNDKILRLDMNATLNEGYYEGAGILTEYFFSPSETGIAIELQIIYRLPQGPLEDRQAASQEDQKFGKVLLPGNRDLGTILSRYAKVSLQEEDITVNVRLTGDDNNEDSPSYKMAWSFSTSGYQELASPILKNGDSGRLGRLRERVLDSSEEYNTLDEILNFAIEVYNLDLKE